MAKAAGRVLFAAVAFVEAAAVGMVAHSQVVDTGAEAVLVEGTVAQRHSVVE